MILWYTGGRLFRRSAKEFVRDAVARPSSNNVMSARQLERRPGPLSPGATHLVGALHLDFCLLRQVQHAAAILGAKPMGGGDCMAFRREKEPQREPALWHNSLRNWQRSWNKTFQLAGTLEVEPYFI